MTTMKKFAFVLVIASMAGCLGTRYFLYMKTGTCTFFSELPMYGELFPEVTALSPIRFRHDLLNHHESVSCSADRTIADLIATRFDTGVIHHAANSELPFFHSYFKEFREDKLKSLDFLAGAFGIPRQGHRASITFLFVPDCQGQTNIEESATGLLLLELQ